MANPMSCTLVMKSLKQDYCKSPKGRRDFRNAPYDLSKVKQAFRFVDESLRDLNNFPDQNIRSLKASNPRSLPRGRPKAVVIPQLISDGTKSESNIKCHLCGRVFPRKKSLTAHLLTHRTERNICCDYPDCNSKFNQSGQLKSHLRIHTGEAPFICPAEGCAVRFKHSNRHCPTHLDLKLVRREEDLGMVIQRQLDNRENKRDDEIRWLENYLEKHKRRSQYQKTTDDIPPTDNLFESSNDGSILVSEDINDTCDLKTPMNRLMGDGDDYVSHTTIVTKETPVISGDGAYINSQSKAIPLIIINNLDTPVSISSKEKSSEDMYAASLLFFFKSWKRVSSVSHSSYSNQR